MATASINELQQVRAENSSVPTIFHKLDNPRFAKAIGAVAAKFFTPERFLRLAINSIKKTPLLAQCDPESVLGAFMASAALGLEPNTVQQQAFLIPYKKRVNVGGKWIDAYDCQFQVGYRGFVTLAHRSPHIDSIQAQAIHEGDLFDHMMGSESFLRYRKALKDRGELIGAFCHTRLSSGIELATVLPLDEIYKIRARSETFNALTRNLESAETAKDKASAQKKYDETPWVMWQDDMAAKSAIKKHAKQLPLTDGDSMSAAAQLDDRSEGATIDLRAMNDVDVVRSVVDDGAEPPALEHMTPEIVQQSIPKAETIHVDRQEKKPAAQARQATQETPDSAAMPLDDGPTLEDALAYVTRDDYEMAQDIANRLGGEAIDAVERAIKVRSKPAATQSGGRFRNVE